jgi:hypothetical protein
MNRFTSRAGFFRAALLCMASAAIFFCKRAKTEDVSGQLASPDLTPEAVVRAYQSYVDRNLFDEAKKLSTEREQGRLEAVQRIIMEESQDSTRLNSVFLRLECKISAGKAACLCRIRDEYETYNTSFSLVRTLKGWLVDVPEEEEIFFEEEQVEAAIDSFFKQSKER